MATCRHVINGALRKLGRLGAGREPRTADSTDALAALQGLYGSWITSGAFGRLRDVVPIATTYTASGNERIIRESAGQLDVVLPELVSDGWVRDYGREGRGGYFGTLITITSSGDTTVVDVTPGQPIGYCEPPRDGSPVVVTDRIGGMTASWLYDGTVKQWQRIDALQLDDQAPRSAADPEGLSATLAAELADMFGTQLGPTTLRQMARFTTAMTHGYGMRRETFGTGVYA